MTTGRVEEIYSQNLLYWKKFHLFPDCLCDDVENKSDDESNMYGCH